MLTFQITSDRSIDDIKPENNYNQEWIAHNLVTNSW